MASYLINKRHRDEAIISMKELDGYVFKPKKSGDGYIKVSSVKIVDTDMTDKILTMKFDKAFKRVVALALKVIQDEDSDEGDTQIVLDEVELVREILLNRYQRFLKYDKEQLFLKKLRLIENELRMKQVAIKQKALYLEAMQEKEKGKSR
ncbi:MAG: hypothetical protein IJ475_01660 [Bacilli bacterium]|nr:hypothetical protein [Bacilli bacterium]